MSNKNNNTSTSPISLLTINFTWSGMPVTVWPAPRKLQRSPFFKGVTEIVEGVGMSAYRWNDLVAEEVQGGYFCHFWQWCSFKASFTGRRGTRTDTMWDTSWDAFDNRRHSNDDKESHLRNRIMYLDPDRRILAGYLTNPFEEHPDEYVLRPSAASTVVKVEDYYWITDCKYDGDTRPMTVREWNRARFEAWQGDMQVKLTAQLYKKEVPLAA